MRRTDGDAELDVLDLSREEDVRFVYEARRHPKVAENLFGSPPDSYEAHRTWLAANMHETRVLYVLKAGGAPVGYCQAVPRGDGEVEAGFVVHPDHQRKGYGEKMVRMLVEVLAEDMPGRKVVLEVKAGNAMALRLYERCGFEPTRVRMEPR